MSTQEIKIYRKEIQNGQIRMMHLRPKGDQLHRHVFFELVYIVSGTATHRLGEESTQIRAGDYFIIDTGSAHCYQDTEDFEIVNCLFLPEYIDRALTDCSSLSSLLSNQVMRFGVPVDLPIADRIFRDTDGSVRRLIKAMEKEYADRQTGCMELLRCLLTQVLVCAVRAYESAEYTRTHHSATTAIAEYLRTHYRQPLSLAALGKQVGYTPQYLSAVFRKDTDMTIQEFLQRLRVEEACRLMNGQEISLTELAQAVGYSDPKHFSRVFRRHKGTTPKEFQSAMK